MPKTKPFGAGKAKKKPVLVLGWGQQGCRDVEWIARVFRRDESIDCAASQFANSREALATIGNWLNDHKNPQTLYLGAHGGETGLTRAVKDTDKIGYRELSDTITANRFSEAPPVNVVLGACHSANAAAIWNTIKQDGINSLIAFPDETDCETVQAVLVEVLKEGNIVEFGAAREEREITYLDDWIKDMQVRFRQVAFHYKGVQRELVDVQTLPTDGAGTFSELLSEQGALPSYAELLETAGLASVLPGVATSVIVPSEDDEPAPLKIRKFVPVRRARKSS